MALANVNITDTFDVWRTRTNQIIVGLDQSLAYANGAYIAANSSLSGTTAAFSKANSANYFAYLVNANTVAAFAAANVALAGGGANAAYDQANAAYGRANVAIANVNYVNVYAQFANTVAISAFLKANSISGGSYYIGNNGRVGDGANGKNDIFRVNNNYIKANLYFSDGENGSATGPLTVNTGYVLQINTGARVVII